MKCALVTGANRGIGRGLTEELAAKGYFVFAGMRDITKSSFKNDQIMPITLDVQDDVSIKAAAKVVATRGPLNILVNNAGTNTTVDGNRDQLRVLNEVSREALLTMFDINTVGPLMVAKYFVPIMTEPDSFIINISSDRASFENENTNANYGYRASKVALNMFTQCLLFDLPKNVSTFAVHPGWVKTDINPQGVLSPAESAQKILHILDIWKPGMNGAYLDTDGSVFPR